MGIADKVGWNKRLVEFIPFAEGVTVVYRGGIWPASEWEILQEPSIREAPGPGQASHEMETARPGVYRGPGARTSRRPTWLAVPTTPSCSMRSMMRAARL
jgi:hypothetical protein